MVRLLGMVSALLKLSASVFCFIDADFLLRNDRDDTDFFVGDRGLSFLEPVLRKLEISLSFSGLQGIASRRQMFQSFRI